MEVSAQLHALATLPPGKSAPAPIGQEAGWSPEPVWMMYRREKPLAPAGIQTQTIQPVAHHYTN
jgi:hypothetical protein